MSSSSLLKNLEIGAFSVHFAFSVFAAVRVLLWMGTLAYAANSLGMRIRS